MKSKLFGIALVAAFLFAGGIWLHSIKHEPVPESIKREPPPVTQTVVSDSSPVAKPSPVKVLVMAVVSTNALAENPSSDAWSLIQMIVDSKQKYDQRLNAFDHLPRHLSGIDCETLLKFLREKGSLDHGDPGQALKNRAMDSLCELTPPPAGLVETLIQVYHDSGQDEVLRDYAVQHLAVCYEQIAAAGLGNNNSTIKEAILGVFNDALRETHSTIAGTALLALKRLSHDYPEIDPASVTTQALKMAGDITAGEQTHITAFQVCAQLGTTNVLLVISLASRNGKTFPVRISAIAALGLLGGADQISFLNGLLQSEEERLKPAARHALEQIARRQK